MNSDIHSAKTTFYAKASDISYAILRITSSLFFLQGGGMKILGWFGGVDGQGATVNITSLIGVAGMLELVGGSLLILGLFTRPVAFILSGEMAFAYFIGHFPNGFWPVQNQGMPAVLYCFLFLYMAAHGAGIYSLDAKIAHRRKTISSQ